MLNVDPAHADSDANATPFRVKLVSDALAALRDHHITFPDILKMVFGNNKAFASTRTQFFVNSDYLTVLDLMADDTTGSGALDKWVQARTLPSIGRVVLAEMQAVTNSKALFLPRNEISEASLLKVDMPAFQGLFELHCPTLWALLTAAAQSPRALRDNVLKVPEMVEASLDLSL